MQTFLRHALATLAYRGGKAVRNAPADFSSFQAGPSSRTAGQILAHIGDLLDWGLSLAQGQQRWQDSAPQTWEQDVARFHAALAAFDAYLASGAPIACADEKLFQGPIADAFTHVGQIGMLRRLAGSPVTGENYFRAGIEIGRLGPEQTPPKREF
ncbi:MAG TPA: hypothetical protein VJN96_14820 [Vicinamibacterales bacterium]|nr:hypothetical protein [Vicinamibacterales bacterium]